jgi:two-component system, NarL family, sensor histidine kinase UhpB
VTLVVTLFVVGVLLVGTTVAALIVQQQRLLRNRASFASRLIAAQDRERGTMARELHDDLVGRMDSVVRSMRQSLDPSTQQLGEEAAELTQALREMARRLHPRIVELQGLPVALEGLVEEWQGHAPIAITCTVEELSGRLSKAAELALFRVAQEAIRNAVRYSGGEHLTVTLGVHGDEVGLSVLDDGSGFAPGEGGARTGIGLLSMEERIQAVGGKLLVRSVRGEGTEVRATLPLEITS